MARDSGNLIVPVALDNLLILSYDIVLKSFSDPFVRLYFLRFLCVVEVDALVVLKIVLERLGLLELFEHHFVKSFLVWLLLWIHAIKDEVED